MIGVKEKNKPIRVYFGHIRTVYSSFAYSNSFPRKLAIQTFLLFHRYFHCIKFYFDRSKGKKIGFLRTFSMLFWTPHKNDLC